MASTRKSPSKENVIRLMSEVSAVCPLCGDALLYEKGKLFSSQEIAHIYPLNPTPSEERLLSNEARLSLDVDHNDNLIPLCRPCHTKFDKPRTVEGYRELFAIKEAAIAHRKWKEAQSHFPVASELRIIVQKLLDGSLETPSAAVSLEYAPKVIEDKLGAFVTPYRMKRVKAEVADYFVGIRELFREMEVSHPLRGDQIAVQVKAHYLALAADKETHETIISRLSDWISRRTQCNSVAADIIVSFFVQNCEVF